MGRKERFRPAERMASFDSSRIRESMRIAAAAGALDLAQGRPEVSPHPAVIEAAVEALRAGHVQYSVTWGLEPLRELIAEQQRERFGARVDGATDVTITCGVTEAIVAVMLALVDPGDEVLIVEPAHENYVPAVRFAGGVPRFVTLRPPDFELPVDRIADSIGPKTRALVLNTPHNPTGRVFGREEVQAVLDLADRHGFHVITDEIYERLVYPPARHVAPSELAPEHELLVTTGGISKIHAVTGWRLGFVIAPAAVSEQVRAVHDYLTICAPTPFQHAALTALALPESHHQEVIEQYRSRRDRLLAGLAESGLEAFEPEGAYYVMADFRPWRVSMGADEFTRGLIEHAGVALVSGTAFYYGDRSGGDRLVRFAFSKDESLIDEACSRLREAFRDRLERGADSPWGPLA